MESKAIAEKQAVGICNTINEISENAIALLEMTFKNDEDETAAIENLIRWNKVKVRSISAKAREYERRRTNATGTDCETAVEVNHERRTLLQAKVVLLKENKELHAMLVDQLREAEAAFYKEMMPVIEQKYNFK